MEKLNLNSPDLVQKNIEAIAAAFPNVITEEKDAKGNLQRAVDFDLLRQELSAVLVEGDKERYQLTWPGKRQAILQANAPINKTLRPVKEDSVDWDTTQNIYIEGDNLEVLKLLQESYLNKVKCIYIDPPYNTGKDFIYKDDFRQSTEEYLQDSGQVDEEGNRLFQNNESNGRFHSDWLTMMYSRLKLARNLLRDDGVIFISIDDNEQVNLAKICDEVFGANNCLGPLIQNKQNAKNDTVNIQKNHEFILVYRKSAIFFAGNQAQATLVNREIVIRDVLKENDEFFYITDAITTRGEGGTLNSRPNLGYTVYYNPETKEKIGVCDYDIEMARTSNDKDSLYCNDQQLLINGFIPIRPPLIIKRFSSFFSFYRSISHWSFRAISSDRLFLLVAMWIWGTGNKPRSFSVSWPLGFHICSRRQTSHVLRHQCA